MLNLKALAEWARDRARGRTEDLDGADMPTRAYAALHQSFDKRLIDACRLVADGPKGVPATLFVALPERLLAKCAYLCLGKSRKPGRDAWDTKPEAVTQHMIDCLKSYDDEGRQAHFMNLDLPDRVEQLRHVLLCHGLTPIDDSILLLADIGRAHRVARVLAVDMRVMLADISWMSSNRSIRQFPTLSEDDIDTGLRVCLDKRTRLYDALSMHATRHEIVPYDKAHKISGRKLDQISERYLALARDLWGTDAGGRLEHESVRRICQTLDRLPLLDDGLPEHMSTLGQFPGALAALEEKLKPHLEILRVIARQFNSFDSEVFSYFFAQYYAQDGYRGSVVKVAPESEQAFDEPFDKLDPYFRAWGDGHSTTEFLSGSIVSDSNAAPLSVAYSPQYSIGPLSVLPYSPLSLDALKRESRDHHALREELILLEDIERQGIAVTHAKNVNLLARTSVVRRNRLVGDIASFVSYSVSQGYGEEVDVSCRKVGRTSLDDLLDTMGSKLPTYFRMDLETSTREELEALWLTAWLENVQVDDEPGFMPTHMFFYLLDESDWTQGRLAAAADLVAVAQLVYVFLT